MKLISHPKYPAHQHLNLSSEIELRNGHFHIIYKASGHCGDIVVTKSASKAMFRDELWKMTCFEMFVQVGDGPQYYEYNFAPNGDWASYHFDDYRSGMKPNEINQPKIILQNSDDEISLDVIMNRQDLPVGELSIGLFAMIFTDDDRSFWALNHNETTPNFHQRDCFLHRLTVK